MYEPEPKFMLTVKKCLRSYRACLAAHLCLSLLQLFTPRPYLFLCHFLVFLVGIDCFCSFLTFKYFCFTVISLICGISDFFWVVLRICRKNKLKGLYSQHYWKTVSTYNIFFQYLSYATHYIFGDLNKSDSTINTTMQNKYEYLSNFFNFFSNPKKTYPWKIYLDLFLLIAGIFFYFLGSYLSWQLYKYSLLNFQQNDFIFHTNAPDYGTFREENNCTAPTTQTDFVPFLGQSYRIADFIEKI